MEILESKIPFRHWVIDGVVPEPVHAAALAAAPPAGSPAWVRYANELEQKWAARADFAPPVADLFADLSEWPWLALLERLTGIGGLRSDPDLWGAGVHRSDPGDHLQPHVDAAVHATRGWDRRVNVIVYLNSEWRPEWGGATELYWPDGGKVAAAVLPAPGRVLVWEAGDAAYHGAAAVAGPTPRVTAAAYFYTAARPAGRTRALFVPKRK